MPTALHPGPYRDAHQAVIARRDELRAVVARELCATARTLGQDYVRGFALTAASITGLVVTVGVVLAGGSLTGRCPGTASLCVAVYGIAHLTAARRWNRLVCDVLPRTADPIRDIERLEHDRPLLGLSRPAARMTSASAIFPLVALVVLSPFLLHLVVQGAFLAADHASAWTRLGDAAAAHLPLVLVAVVFATALVKIAGASQVVEP